MSVKEVTNNIIKHAGAAHVRVRMASKDSVLTINIQDDGRGFQPADHGNGNGLKNIRQRFDDMGGICVVSSDPGHGTSIQMRLKVGPNKLMSKNRVAGLFTLPNGR
jgi:signal transduction histidine kinase